MKKTYTGEFKDSHIQGFGNEVWDDGRTYVGFFEKGRKHGDGTITYLNKKQYKGQWVKNKKHGVGYEINLRSYTQRKGEWLNGKWIRWTSKTEKIGKEQTEVSKKMAETIELKSLTSQIDVNSDIGDPNLNSPV